MDKDQTNLYDYVYIQLGCDPGFTVIDWKKILMDSPRGRAAKHTIDAAVALMTTFNSQKFDAGIISVVMNYLTQFVLEESNAKKV